MGGDPQHSNKRGAKWLLGGGIAALAVQLILMVAIAGATLSAVAIVGQAIDKVLDGVSAVIKLPGSLVDIINKDDRLVDAVKTELDCANVDDEAAEKGRCTEGLIDFGEDGNQSVVPTNKLWLVPVWKQAENEYGVEWELLAAINGARTFFGARNCEGNELTGDGWYRITRLAWAKYRTDGGSTKNIAGERCHSSKPPTSFKQNGTTNRYDAVDATFTLARMLRHQGAARKEWKYNGSDPRGCVPDPKYGRVWNVPLVMGKGARMGYNRNLYIPRDLVRLAARYRSDTGKWKPTKDKNAPKMPREHIIRLLRGVWEAFGLSGAQLEEAVAKNYRRIMQESSGSPQAIQRIEDINSRTGNHARGLFQFTPPTFAAWKVDGYDDIYNPLDNILAAVNAQVNSLGYFLDSNGMGWGPRGGTNPYKTGGRAYTVDTTGKGDKKRVVYKGKKPTDEVSKAVAFRGPGLASEEPCYVAIVHEWYEELKANPPDESLYLGDASGVRAKIVKVLQSQVGKKENPMGSNCNPYSRDLGRPCEPWCGDFVTWVMRKAGVKVPQVLSAAYQWYTVWGKPRGLVKTAMIEGDSRASVRPEPGDIIIWGSDPRSLASTPHVSMVERVLSDGRVYTIGGNESNQVLRQGPIDLRKHTGWGALVAPVRAGGSDSGESPAANRPSLPRYVQIREQ
jgi:hypothetical protein